MAINLIDMVKESVDGEARKQLGWILGASEEKASSAFDAAVPSLLGGLMRKASTSDGAQAIYQSLDDFDGNILHNLGGLLAGDHTGLLNTGSEILAMVLGDQQKPLVGALAKLVGIGNGSASTLLGVLAPIVMGVLGKQRRAQSLDVSGLTSLLMSQQGLIAQHIPQEISTTLGLDSMPVGSSVTQSSPSQGVQASGKTANHAGNTSSIGQREVEPTGGSLVKTLIPLLILGGLALLAYKMFTGGGANNIVDVARDVVPTNTESFTDGLDATTLGANGFELPDLSNLDGITQGLTHSLGTLNESISGIRDLDTAKAAISKFEQAEGLFDAFNNGIHALPEEGKTTVHGVLSPLLQKLQSALETAYAIPGVRSLLEPVATPLLQKLNGLTG